MISSAQLLDLAKKFKTNEAAVLREYLQILFLSKLYGQAGSGIFFKGGTAIHLLFGAPRFSEDLDFTVTLPEKEFKDVLDKVFADVKREIGAEFKLRESVAGRRYLMTVKVDLVKYATFINLDFSFRENVFRPEKSTMETEFPILLTSFIWHLSAQEIMAEKIRAILTREKGRDVYDLWLLLSKGIVLDDELVLEKLKYYNMGKDDLSLLPQRIGNFSEKDFVNDLRPFVAISERNNLSQLFSYVRSFISNKLTLHEPR